MTTTADHPTENLVRSLALPATVTRAADDETGEPAGPPILFGEFARFNEWTTIESYFEGEFMERIAPGAFDRTIAEDLARVKVLYDHGHDPQLGNKPLGPIRSVTPTDTGMAYEVELIDTSYNRDFIEPAARAGLLGASFRMVVRRNEWVDPDKPSEHNPRALPERTITDIGLFEFGPVTFPAYEGADAQMRSRSDEWFGWMLNDVEFVQRFAARTNPLVLGKVLEQCRESGYPDNRTGPNGPPAAGTNTTNGQSQRQPATRSHQAARLELLKLRG